MAEPTADTALLDIARADRPNSRHWRQTAVTWSELLAWTDDPDNVKECGNYVLGKLRETVRTDHGDGGSCQRLHRTRDAVVHRSAITLDVDYPSENFIAQVEAHGWMGLAHTTYSSKPKTPRYRLILRTDRAMTPEEYMAASREVMEQLGRDNFDPSTWHPERYMFLPAAQKPEWFERWVLEGEPLSVDMLLFDAAQGVQEAPEDDLATASADHAPGNRSRGSEATEVHPYAARAIAAELARLDALPQPWSEGDHWDSTTFEVACKLVEFANSGWSGYSLADAEWDLYEHAPADDTWGRAEHEAKWRSAVKKVAGGSRPDPGGEAAEAFASDSDTPVPNTNASTATDAFGPFIRMTIAELLDPNRPKREYVVEPMLATGTSVALIAPAGHRKSLLALGLSVAVARGDRDFAGMPIPRARRVVYIDMENTEDDLSERLVSFGVSATDALDRLILVPLPSMDPLDTAKGGEALMAALDAFALEPGDLVVLDSYQRVTAAGENDSDTTRGYYRYTGVHLKARGLTVIRTDNTGKDASKGARGSSGKRDDVDVEYILKSEGNLIGVTTGKVRQRGVGPMTFEVSTDDAGRTRFQSQSGSPAWRKVEDCVVLLDQLDVQLKHGEGPAGETLREAGHEIRREVLRAALKARKKRAAEARRTFDEEPADEGYL